MFLPSTSLSLCEIIDIVDDSVEEDCREEFFVNLTTSDPRVTVDSANVVIIDNDGGNPITIYAYFI